MSFSILKNDDKQNLLLIFLSSILFYINEHIKFKISIPYLDYILKSHCNDFLAGLSFMALINIILLFSKYKKIKTLKVIIIISILCGIFWEVIAPLFITSTRDFWDMVSYTLGFFLYWIIKRFSSIDTSYTIK